MNPDVEKAWGVAILGWIIGLGRIIFGAGTLSERIKRLEENVKDFAVHMEKQNRFQLEITQSVGRIEGELKRMNGRGHH